MMSGLKRSRHLSLPIKDIELATGNFETCIGKGGYGRVYKGELYIVGKLTTVAVKRLDVQFGQGLKEFLTEIELLTGQQHPNLISLLGYCDEGDEKIIVYEYAERGSLEQYIRHSNTSYMTLTWLERLRICIDSARGIDHLHSHVGKHQSIIHRDIKSANILLDANLVAKISDFGLSKLSLAGLGRSAVISHACGTPGYCEPEYIFSGIVTKKSDVYSFGMVLLEVLCGKLCTVRDKDGSLLSAKLAKECYKNNKLDEIIDPSLRKQMSSYSMSRFSAIAYGCLDDDREQRPSMGVVKKELEEILEIQGWLQITPSPYNNSTRRRHLEQNYVPNGHLNRSLDNDNHQKFPHMRDSQNVDHAYDYNRVNSRYEDATDDNYFPPPPMNDGVDYYPIEVQAGPGIEDFQIIGEAKPGGKILGCGFPVRGTSSCLFQWVRHLQDGSMEYIEGATNPEYVVIADDVDKVIAVECIPMDEEGCQGKIVRRFANEQNKITCDPEMQQEIDKYMSMDSSENWEQTTFSLRRSNYQIKINRTQDIFIEKKYSSDLLIRIPAGLTTQFVLTRRNGFSHSFNTLHDVRMRDTLVLTMRMFQSKALDERRKTKA